jgi:hypothetical protein
MKHISPSTPYGYTIFCDDVRQEDNGKLLLIGVYAGVMFVPSFPFAAPRLTFRVTYFERIQESTEPVQIRVYFPDDGQDSPTIKLDLSEDFRKAVPPEPVSDASDWDKPEFFLTGLFNLGISPFVMQRPGLIRVRAQRGEESIKLSSLRVMLKPSEPERVGDQP